MNHEVNVSFVSSPLSPLPPQGLQVMALVCPLLVCMLFKIAYHMKYVITPSHKLLASLCVRRQGHTEAGLAHSRRLAGAGRAPATGKPLPACPGAPTALSGPPRACASPSSAAVFTVAMLHSYKYLTTSFPSFLAPRGTPSACHDACLA